MTREQEAAIVDAWHSWNTKKPLRSEDYLDFYDSVVRRTKLLRRLHVFEVLDVVVNTEHLLHEAAPRAHERRSA